MSAIKNHAHVIIKLMLNHFVSAIFGLTLFMSTWKNPALCLASSLLAICFHVCLIYSIMWEAGAKDEVSVTKHKKSTGIILISFAQIPAILSTLTQFFSSFFLSEGETFADSIYAAAYAINVVFIQSMYSGFLNYFTPDSVKISSLAVLLSVIPALISGTLGYFSGRRGFRILPEFGKNKKK